VPYHWGLNPSSIYIDSDVKRLEKGLLGTLAKLLGKDAKDVEIASIARADSTKEGKRSYYHERVHSFRLT